LRNIGIFNNTLASSQEKAPQTEEVCWQKKESICLVYKPKHTLTTSLKT